jgi:hypothetical protein
MIPQAEIVFKMVAEILKDEQLKAKSVIALQRYFVHKFVPLMSFEGIANMTGQKSHSVVWHSIVKVESDPNLKILKNKIELYLRRPDYKWLPIH